MSLASKFTIQFPLFCLLNSGIITAAMDLEVAQIGGMTPLVDFANCYKKYSTANKQKHPEIGLTTPEVIRRSGYPVETHTTITQDGYILNVFRIPFSPSSPRSTKTPKKAIYLNHGLGGNAQSWLLQCSPKNLAFILADAGFDVFLSNCRGSSYSPDHVNITKNDPLYWDFSWDELGRYDVPAVINLITKLTEDQKMYYAGHSMGTTQYFVALSELPELNDRIYAGFLLSPIAFISHSKNAIRYLAPLAKDGQYLFRPALGGKLYGSAGNYQGSSKGHFFEFACEPTAVSCGACGNLMFLLFGYDPPQTNYTNIPLYNSIYPDTISTKNAVHYAQSMTKGTFRKFDYGSTDMNNKIYGRFSPPDYNLSRITVPTLFFYGQNDNLGVPQDILITASKMTKSALKKVIKIDWDLFTHFDFAIAKDADVLLYNIILQAMLDKTYES